MCLSLVNSCVSLIILSIFHIDVMHELKINLNKHCSIEVCSIITIGVRETTIYHLIINIPSLRYFLYISTTRNQRLNDKLANKSGDFIVIITTEENLRSFVHSLNLKLLSSNLMSKVGEFKIKYTLYLYILALVSNYFRD